MRSSEVLVLRDDRADDARDGKDTRHLDYAWERLSTKILTHWLVMFRAFRRTRSSWMTASRYVLLHFVGAL
jgi:hypothetical protein